MAWTDQIFVTVLMLVAFLVFWRLLRHRDVDERLTKFWTSLPSVGLRGGGWFSWTWAVLRSITKSAGNAAEGYHRFSKHGLCFVLPSTGTGAIVVLPPSQLHLLNRSENQVAAFQAQLESIQPHYMIGDKNLYENTIEFDIVRKQLTRDVGYFAAMTVEELDAAFKECWGTSKEWTTIGAWDTCAKIIARAANRAFVGLPLCRDETFLEQSRLYAIAVYGGASVIAALPKVVRPVVGPLVALAAKRYLAACKRDLVPYVEERLRQVGKNWEDAPDDVLQWLIKECAKAGPGEMDPSRIAQRLLLLNLVSIYTTSYAFTNCILDLYGSESRDDFITGLQEECDRVSGAYDGLSTKEAINKLYRIDSSVKESMRLSCFGIVSLPRIVASSEGLELGNDIRIPAGVRLGIPSQAIHYDDGYYDNPLTFDAFRFSRPCEQNKTAGRQEPKQELSVSVSESFLTYGYGKHACPGRWFASQMMKAALAHVVQNYEVERIGGKPEKKALLNMILPPTDAQIRVRRRA